MVMGERTQDTRAPKGGDHGEGDPGGMGGRTGHHCMGRGGETWGCSWRGSVLEEGSPGQCWVRGQILKEKGIPWRRSPREGLTSSVLVHHA